MMKIKYPYYSNLIDIKPKLGTDKYNLYEKISGFQTEVSKEEIHTARQFDGKKSPCMVLQQASEEEVAACIDILRKKHLIRWDNGFSLYNKMTLFKAFYLRGVTNISRQICIIYNRALMALCLPTLFIASLCLIINTPRLILLDWMSIVGIIIGLIFGMIMHELSHAMSGLAYGAEVYEFGVQLLPLIAGYAFVDTDMINSRSALLQISLSGIESNLMLAGVLGILSIPADSFGMIWFAAGAINILMGVMNLIPIFNLDGMDIFRILKKKD